MSSVEISILVFTFAFGSALLGVYFDPLKAETRDQVLRGVGLLTSMFALLLSLQLSSGKTAFDTQEAGVTLLASKISMLDRVLAHYGPEAQVARELLRENTVELLNEVWPEERSETSTWAPQRTGDEVYDRIQALSPKDDSQRSERTLALGMAVDLAEMRSKSAARVKSSTSGPLMLVEISWAIVIFASFGLLAPRNVMVIGSLAVCAAAVSGAFFLIAELNSPYSGLLHVSSVPIREVIEHIAR